jgi:hypothetical protein
MRVLTGSYFNNVLEIISVVAHGIECFSLEHRGDCSHRFFTRQARALLQCRCRRFVRARIVYSRSAKNRAAASTVVSMSSAVCAALTNPASYSAGAKYTPLFSMAWKNLLKDGLSVVITVL